MGLMSKVAEGRLLKPSRQQKAEYRADRAFVKQHKRRARKAARGRCR